MTTKYAGLLLFTVFLSALWMGTQSRGERFPWRSLAAAVLVVALFFIVLNPYMILQAEKAWEILQNTVLPHPIVHVPLLITLLH